MNWRRVVVITAIAVAAAAVGATPVWATDLRDHESSCGTSRLIVEDGRPATFALPDNGGETLEVDSEDILVLKAENVPPGSEVRWRVSGLGGFGEVTRPIGQATQTTIDLADYSQYGRGLFKLDVAILDGATEICSTTFSVKITGFGGTAGVASAAAAGVTGTTALLSAAYNANGIRAKLKVKVQRRRSIGWRRWIPVPAWKRTIIGTIIGAITGLCVTALLQQTSFAPLSLASAIRGIAAGGVVSFSAGIGLGAIWTFVKSPLDPEASGAGEATEAGGAGEASESEEAGR